MLQKQTRVRQIWVLVLLAALLAGCRGGTAVSQATPTPAPTETSQPPTSTPVPPTATPAPTETPLPPTPTITETLEPTDTATPAPTETPTSTPTFTPPPTSALQTVSGGWGTSDQNLLMFFILLDTDGNVGCGDTAVGYRTGLLRSGDIASDVKTALARLFGVKSEYLGETYNPLFRSNLAVNNVTFDSSDGLINVELTGTYTPSGNDCDNTRVKAQIWNTIRQYRDVKKTNIYLNGIPFGDRLSNDK